MADRFASIHWIFCAPHIGFVPQETFLFSDSIRDNIAFVAQDATMTTMFAAPPR